MSQSINLLMLSAYLLLGSAALAFAQEVTLSGIILDQSGNPLNQIEVEIESLGLKDTTDADGKWEILTDSLGTTLDLSPSGEPQGFSQSLNYSFGILTGNSVNAAQMQIEILNHQGQILTQTSRFVPRGAFSLNFTRELNSLPANNYLIRATHDSQVVTLEANHVGPVQAQAQFRTSIADKLLYRLQGQIITEDQIDQYKQYIEKFLVVRNISGTVFANNNAAIDEVRAHFSGETIAGEVVSLLGYSSQTGDYTGKVYSVKPLDLYNYSIWVGAQDVDNRLVGRTDKYPFTSIFGDLTLPDFDAANAMPRFNPTFSQDTASVNDSILIYPNAYDTLGRNNESGMDWWTLSWDGGVYTERDSLLEFKVDTPNEVRIVPFVLKGADIEGNIASYSFTFDGIINHGAAISGFKDTTVTIGDTVHFDIVAYDDDGVDSVRLNFNDGQGWIKPYAATSFSHEMPASVTVNLQQDYQLDVMLIDVLGDTNLFREQVIVTVKNDLPVIGLLDGAISAEANVISTYQVTTSDLGTIQKYEWDMNEGLGYEVGTQTLEAIWVTTGTKNLRVKVTDEDGNQSVQSLVVDISNRKSSITSLTNQVVTIGDIVNFTVTPSDADTVQKVIWNFNDGTAEITTTTPHTVLHNMPTSVAVSLQETFELSIKVIDNLGDTTTFSNASTITVKNDLPTIQSITGSEIATAGIAETYTSTVNDLGSIVQYEWDNGSGAGYVIGVDSLVVNWSLYGTKSVKLRVTDEDGNVSTATQSVIVSNRKSSITSLTNQVVTIGDAVNFTVTPSDADGVQEVIWNFNDGTPTITTITPHIVLHNMPTSVAVSLQETFNLSIKVIDNLGDTTTFSSASTITVKNDLPTIQSIMGTETATAGIAETYTSTVNDLGSIVQYEWDNGSGAGYVIGVDSLVVNWSLYGTKSVKLRVTDEDGNVSTATQSVIVSNRKSSMNALIAEIVTIGDTIQQHLTVNDPDGVAKVYWNFNDGLAIDSTMGPHINSHIATSVIPLGNEQQYQLNLIVVDSLNDSTIFNNVSLITVKNDIPGITPILGPDTLNAFNNGTYKVTTSDWGLIKLLEWDLGSGYELLPDSIQTSFGSAGAKTLKVRATDDDDNQTVIQKSIYITTVSGTIQGMTQSETKNIQVGESLSITGIDPEDIDILHINWGDGALDSITGNDTLTLQHTYDVYAQGLGVEVTLVDSAGDTTYVSGTINVARNLNAKVILIDQTANVLANMEVRYPGLELLGNSSLQGEVFFQDDTLTATALSTLDSIIKVYYKGDLIAVDTLPTRTSTVQSIISTRSVAGAVAEDSLGRSIDISSAVVKMTGDDIPDTITAPVAYAELIGTYNGAIYNKYIPVQNLTAWVEAYNDSNQLVARSQNFTLGVDYGDIPFPEFTKGNSYPAIDSITGPRSSLVNEDQIWTTVSADPFGKNGAGVIQTYWSLDSGVTRIDSGANYTHKWLNEGTFVLTTIVQDNEGLEVSDTLSVVVSSQPASVTGMRDTVIDLGDSVYYDLSINHPEGVANVIIHWADTLVDTLGAVTDTIIGLRINSALDSTKRGSLVTLKVVDLFGGIHVQSATIFMTSGVIIDERDDEDYNWVRIGTQVWMAENLAYLPQVDEVGVGSESGTHYYVYDYTPSGANETEQVANAKLEPNYQTDGVLYNWNAAMNGATSSFLAPSGVQGACPSGWHLPSDAEWTILNNYVDANNGADEIGTSLKAISGWTSWLGVTGTDEFGFSALPSGYRSTGSWLFLSHGNNGYFWSASEYSSTSAYYLPLIWNIGVYQRLGDYKSSGFSVRCLEDTP